MNEMNNIFSFLIKDLKFQFQKKIDDNWGWIYNTCYKFVEFIVIDPDFIFLLRNLLTISK